MCAYADSAPRTLFGAFEVSWETRELLKHGVRIRLPGKSFDLLTALLARPGAVVTREELQRRLWREDSSSDFETGLNTAAHRLRVTLGDTAGKPRYIETLARAGYRFIAPVNTKIETPSDHRETPPDSFHFGIFELRLHTGELLKHGIKVNLQQRPLQFLRLLLERRGSVVTREELRALLWHLDDSADFSNNLNSAANRLRFTLGDSAENPCYIATMPGVGYRFIAPVREAYPADEVRAVTDAIEGLAQEEQTRILRAAAARLGLGEAFP
jgi:DNA-binding winged helix-turn-helix (wHTH) protein